MKRVRAAMASTVRSPRLGQDCMVVAPSLVPTRPGDHVKTNRRDAVSLPRLHRAGELTAVWVPEAAHEAMRDLIRARTSAVEDLRAARQRLQGFLLRHDLIYSGRSHWTQAHRRWLAGLAFDHPAQQIVFQEYLHAIDDAEARRDRLTRQIRERLPCWSMAPLVAALPAMRGVALLAAVTLVAEIGDFRRFANPRQLMAYLGLVPSEYSSGKRVARGRLTKAGNSHARRVLVEGAWTYRMPARVSPHVARASGWLAQRGPRDCLEGAGSVVCALPASGRQGKTQDLVTTAIAREMAAFAWAVAQHVEPTPAA